jgi:hypothetical protein
MATGVRDGKLASLIVSQMSAMQVWGSSENQAERLMNAMWAVREMEPKNVTEAMLRQRASSQILKYSMNSQH